MYAKSKTILAFFVVSAILLLSSCIFERYDDNGDDGDYIDPLAAAILDGMIIALEDAHALAETYTVAEARSFDLVRTFNLIANPIMARQHVPRFQRLERSYLNEIYVEVGQLVSEGDVLASSRYVPTDAFMTRYRHAVEELNIMREDTTLERSRLRAEIIELQYAVDSAPGAEWEEYARALAFAELAYDQFVFESRLALNRSQETVNEMSEIIAGEQLRALFDGVVIFVGVVQTTRLEWLWEDHLLNFVAIADPDSMMFHIEPFRFGDLDTEEHTYIVRYGDILNITVDRYDYSFDAVVVNDPNVEGGGIHRFLMPLDMDSVLPIFSVVDYDVMAFTRLVFRTQTTWHRYSDAVVIPTEAIQWDVHSPYVLLYDNGFVGRRLIILSPYTIVDPSLGPRQHTHVLSGIEPGQQVMIP